MVKVESDRHDAGRIIGGGGHHQISGAAVNLQRNKRSIQVDLKQPAGRDVLFRLVAGADVFITNMRPAALERLGLDHGAFADQPQLIYCEAHGFRTGTADAERPAFDDIIQAETGLPRLHERIGSPTAFMPALMADKVSGLYIVQAVLAALVHQRTHRARSAASSCRCSTPCCRSTSSSTSPAPRSPVARPATAGS